jgi:hypothetical protein
VKAEEEMFSLAPGARVFFVFVFLFSFKMSDITTTATTTTGCVCTSDGSMAQDCRRSSRCGEFNRFVSLRRTSHHDVRNAILTSSSSAITSGLTTYGMCQLEIEGAKAVGMCLAVQTTDATASMMDQVTQYAVLMSVTLGATLGLIKSDGTDSSGAAITRGVGEGFKSGVMLGAAPGPLYSAMVAKDGMKQALDYTLDKVEDSGNKLIEQAGKTANKKIKGAFWKALKFW